MGYNIKVVYSRIKYDRVIGIKMEQLNCKEMTLYQMISFNLIGVFLPLLIERMLEIIIAPILIDNNYGFST